MAELLDTLTQINLNDLVTSFGWEDRPLLAKCVRSIFRRPARLFASQMLTFDAMVGSHSLMEAAVALMLEYTNSVKVYGGDNVPDGPVLALSNHPGMMDTLVLFAALGRTDLRIIADHNPFLKTLPHVNQRLDYVSEDPGKQISLVRRVIAYLRSGGAVLTFPAGTIEPDPDVYPGAEEKLREWTDSVGIFVRMAPETTVLPILVRGVIWERTARHPLTRLKKDRYEREKLAAAFQLLAHTLFKRRPLNVTVQIGKPITLETFESIDKNAIHNAVVAEMKHLLAIQPEGLCETFS